MIPINHPQGLVPLQETPQRVGGRFNSLTSVNLGYGNGHENETILGCGQWLGRRTPLRSDLWGEIAARLKAKASYTIVSDPTSFLELVQFRKADIGVGGK